jgi:glycosyltransferase involved in cell wall biosynthesis
MSGSEITLSVIIPTYNRAALVDRCIRSLHRSSVPGLEVVVVDDGGNDDTEAVVRSHGATYLRQANAGPATARNNGFATSQGRYVAFIDSDDEWLAGGVHRLFDQMEANPDLSVIFADALMGNDDDGFVSFVGTYGADAFLALPHTARAGGLRVLERQSFFVQLSTRNVMFLGSMLIRHDFFAATGGFDRNLCGAADWDFFMRATASGTIGYSEGEAASRYYKHDTAMSSNSDHMEEDFIRALDSVRKRSALDDVEESHVNERIRAHVFGWAWDAYNRGNHVEARRRLLWARQLGLFKGREAAYLLATYLPRQLLSLLRRTRRGVAA